MAKMVKASVSAANGATKFLLSRSCSPIRRRRINKTPFNFLVNEEKFLKTLLILSSFLILTIPSKAQAFDWFRTHDTLEIKVSGKLSDIFAEREESKIAYHPATIEMFGMAEEVKIKVRGNRRAGYYWNKKDEKKIVCSSPMLKIKGASADNLYFEHNEAYYFVSHCNDNENDPHYIDEGGLRGGDDYLLQEYSIYRIQEILTKIHAKVRLLKVTYTDTDNKFQSYTRFGFIVENFQYLADKYNYKVLPEKSHIDLQKLSFSHTLRQGLFNFLAANGDSGYQEDHRHNILLLEKSETEIIPVAFDFNQSAFSSHYDFFDKYPIKIPCEKYNEIEAYEVFRELLEKQNEVESFLSDFIYFSNFDRSYILNLTQKRFDHIQKVLDQNLVKLEPHITYIFESGIPGEPKPITSKKYCGLGFR